MAVTGVKRQKDDFRVNCPPICKQADNWEIAKRIIVSCKSGFRESETKWG